MSKKSMMRCTVLAGLLLLFGLFAGGTTSLAAETDYPDIKPGETDTVNYVSMDGIEFCFDKEYTVGRFANGDYWVLGPLVIIQMTPEYDGYSNGWEVNPMVKGGHGFQDGGYGGGFDSSLVPQLPYTADTSKGILSIVKTMRAFDEGKRPCIQRAVVLTVVPTIPRNNGDGVFRPPYIAEDKPYYYVEDIRTDLLPTYQAVDNMPTLKQIEDKFSKLWMDHKGGQCGRGIRPKDSMNNYYPDNNYFVTGGVLRLMMDDPLSEKMPALINYLQYGIDKAYTILDGQTWPDGGGHQPGHRITPAFAAVLLEMDDVKEVLKEATFFHGNQCFYRGKDGVVLWGGSNSEWNYWNYILNSKSARSNRDPYHYIDGGRAPDGSYQFITSDVHKAEILATYLMPELKEAWNMSEWNLVSEYVDRWVYFGLWTAPDPIAAYDGVKENYGITYGPDAATGDPILGEGRYVTAHGTLRDTTEKSAYKSAFTRSVWDAYRTQIPGAETTPPYAAIISPLDGRTVEGVKTLQTTAYGIHGIASVQYYLDGKAVGTPVTQAQTESPFAYELDFDFTKVTVGAHALYAVATDGKGNTYQSKTISLYKGSGSLIGDMNDDGVVDIKDLAFIAQNIGRTGESAGWSAIKKADMNSDGKIDVVDLSAVARIVN